MEIEEQNNTFQLKVSRDQLQTLAGCLNEALEIVDEFEFQTRLGVERAEVIRIRDQLLAALRQFRGHNT